MRTSKVKGGYLNTCDNCQKEFFSRSTVSRRFCCVSCSISDKNKNRHAFGNANPNWRGGTRARYKEDHPDRTRANNIVYNEIRYGRLKQQPCVDCNAPTFLSQAHHEDYSKPLEVMWLCPSCHAKRSFKKREEEKCSA